MFTISQADVFLLSRFVSDADLGVYQLANRTGIVVALLPGAFRVAMRPLRKSLSFKAVQDEYGRAVARGQQLTYFFLICIVALLAVTLLSQVLAHLAPSGYADAAGIVPLVAAGLMGTSVMRSISQAVSIPNKRITFILGAVTAALTFVGLSLVLIPEIGLEGAPVAMLAAFSIPCLFMLGRSQLGLEPIQLPYGRLAAAALLAAAIAAGYELLGPENGYAELALSVVLFAAYLVALPALQIVPRHHWGALLQIVRNQFARTRGTSKFDAERALAALDDADRVALRIAIVKGKPVAQVPERLANRGIATNGSGDADGGALVVGALRRAADEGGTPVREGKKAARRWGSPEDRDAVIADYLFPEGTVAQRDAQMRKLLDEGVRSDELMALESILTDLQAAPGKAWKGSG
jgi:hypothetical protein